MQQRPAHYGHSTPLTVTSVSCMTHPSTYLSIVLNTRPDVTDLTSPHLLLLALHHGCTGSPPRYTSCAALLCASQRPMLLLGRSLSGLHSTPTSPQIPPMSTHIDIMYLLPGNSCMLHSTQYPSNAMQPHPTAPPHLLLWALQAAVPRPPCAQSCCVPASAGCVTAATITATDDPPIIGSGYPSMHMHGPGPLAHWDNNMVLVAPAVL